MNKPKRKPMRLKNYDYSANGCYFITICSHNKEFLFSKIEAEKFLFDEIKLTEWGGIVEKQLLDLEKRYGFLRIDNYVIMPNHIHAILVFENEVKSAGASPCPTLSDVVCTFKSLSIRQCKKEGFTGALFQTGYYDHIIRGDEDYANIWNYIEANPSKWNLDKYYL